MNLYMSYIWQRTKEVINLEGLFQGMPAGYTWKPGSLYVCVCMMQG